MSSESSRKVELVLERLKSRGISFITEAYYSDATQKVVVEIPRSCISESISEKTTSRRQMSALFEKIYELDRIEVDYVVVSGARDPIFSALSLFVSNRFDGLAEVLSVKAADAVGLNVELSVAGDLSASDINESLNEFTLSLGLQLSGVTIVESGVESLAVSKFQILREVKISAPALLSDIESRLELSNVKADSKRISRILDGLRKEGLVIRRSDSKFVLTAAGLSVVPALAVRSGSDVLRLLAFRSKKWKD